MAVTGDVRLPDYGGQPAWGAVFFYDDGYDTRWDVVRPGNSISFAQWNWPYFRAGLIYDDASAVDEFTGAYTLDVTSSTGGRETSYTLYPEATVDISSAFRQINVSSGKQYSATLSGSVRIPDNGADWANGVLVLYEKDGEVRWSVLEPGGTLRFTQDERERIYVGMIHHAQYNIENTTGAFTFALTAEDGGVGAGDYTIDKRHMALIPRDE